MTMALGAISLLSSGVQAVSQMQSANAQAGAYKQQAYNTRLQAQSQAAQYEQQAAQQMQEVLQYQARARSLSASMGVDTSMGGALRLQEEAGEAGGQDMTQSLTNAQLALSGGNLQAAQYDSAASSARMGGLLNALGTIGNAASNFAQIGGPPSAAGAGGASSLKLDKQISAASGGIGAGNQFNTMFAGGPQPYKNRTMLGG